MECDLHSCASATELMHKLKCFFCLFVSFVYVTSKEFLRNTEDTPLRLDTEATGLTIGHHLGEPALTPFKEEFNQAVFSVIWQGI